MTGVASAVPDGFEARAREALAEVTPQETVGDLLVAEASAEDVVDLAFASRLPGYVGWRWTVSMTRLPDEEPSVLEVELLPGEGALLAPPWVPWAERLAEYRRTHPDEADVDADEDLDEDLDEELDDDEDELDPDEDVLDDEADDVLDGVDFEATADADEGDELDDLDDVDDEADDLLDDEDEADPDDEAQDASPDEDDRIGRTDAPPTAEERRTED